MPAAAAAAAARSALAICGTFAAVAAPSSSTTGQSVAFETCRAALFKLHVAPAPRQLYHIPLAAPQDRGPLALAS